jgi:hypothetical protein
VKQVGWAERLMQQCHPRPATAVSAVRTGTFLSPPRGCDGRRICNVPTVALDLGDVPCVCWRVGCFGAVRAPGSGNIPLGRPPSPISTIPVADVPFAVTQSHRIRIWTPCPAADPVPLSAYRGIGRFIAARQASNHHRHRRSDCRDLRQAQRHRTGPFGRDTRYLTIIREGSRRRCTVDDARPCHPGKLTQLLGTEQRMQSVDPDCDVALAPGFDQQYAQLRPGLAAARSGGRSGGEDGPGLYTGQSGAGVLKAASAPAAASAAGW